MALPIMARLEAPRCCAHGQQLGWASNPYVILR
jgi:hypothetical protein